MSQVAELQIFNRIEDLPGPHLPWQEIEGLAVAVEKAGGGKCVRCWFTYPTVGKDPKHPQLCARCSQVLKE